MRAVTVTRQFTHTPAVAFIALERLALCAKYRDIVVLASPLGGWLFGRASVLPSLKACGK